MDAIETRVYRNESIQNFNETYNQIKAYRPTPSFIWSDGSAAYHSINTRDWANGAYIHGIPSGLVTVTR